jgi:hypothetical protein
MLFTRKIKENSSLPLLGVDVGPIRKLSVIVSSQRADCVREDFLR